MNMEYVVIGLLRVVLVAFFRPNVRQGGIGYFSVVVKGLKLTRVRVKQTHGANGNCQRQAAKISSNLLKVSICVIKISRSPETVREYWW